jgi:protein-tyrosine phosphatase
VSEFAGVDLHSHVIPGVDDGARDLAESQAALRVLAEQGMATVVASPHVDGSLTLSPGRLAARLGEIDAGWAELYAAHGDAALKLRRGVELKLDVPEVDLTDARLRLGGGRAVLVEFPFLTVPPRSAAALSAIRQSGYVPVLAHPERYAGAAGEMRLARSWLEAGAVFQVNAGSLLGRYGADARRTALALLARGWVACMASDYHSRGAPLILEVRALLERWGCRAQLELLLAENPARLLRDEPCRAVDPVVPRGTMKNAIRRMLQW